MNAISTISTTEAPNFDRAYTMSRDGQMPLADAFDLAFGIDCVDSAWSLNANPDGALAAMFTLGDDIFECSRECRHEAYFARLGAYYRIREALEAIYPDASCSVTDPWTFDTYSDLYKDDNGCRPRSHITGKAARDWILRRDAE